MKTPLHPTSLVSNTAPPGAAPNAAQADATPVHTTVRSHSGIRRGIRVLVYKPASDVYTTIYVNAERLQSLMAFAHNDLGAITHACRHASLTSVPEEGTPWSHTVLNAARSYLRARFIPIGSKE